MTLSTADYLFRINRVLNTSSKEYACCGVTLNQALHNLASLQLEIPAGVDAVYFINRNTDDLPLSIVGRATWDMFSGNHRQSYWIQYTNVFGGSIEFINDQWYHIFWSDRINSYFTEGDQFVEEPGIVGLGHLAELLNHKE